MHYNNTAGGAPLYQLGYEAYPYFDYDVTYDTNGNIIAEHNTNPSASAWSSNEFQQALSSRATGTMIRFGKRENNGTGSCKEKHTAILVSASNNGVTLYECNNDGFCGVFLTYYTYEELASKYHCVRYRAFHNFEGNTTKTFWSSSKHKVKCKNCVGYVLSNHTTSKHTGSPYASQYHTISYSCCNFSTTESHDVSTLRKYPYNETQHQITYLCCGYYRYENHVFYGTSPECAICGDDPYYLNKVNKEELE